MRLGQPPAHAPAPQPPLEPNRRPGFRVDSRRAAFMEARTLDLITWLRARRQRGADRPAPLSSSPPAGDETRRNPPCVRCQCARTHRWGSFRGRQRWRCLGCRRTFSDLTGTIFFRTWEPAAWLTFVAHLKETPTVRESARVVGINKDTALRWRHRLLDALGAGPVARPRSRAGESRDGGEGNDPDSWTPWELKETRESVATFIGVFHPIHLVQTARERRGRGEGMGVLLIRDLETVNSSERRPPLIPSTSAESSHRGLVLQRVIRAGTADHAARTISTELTLLRLDPARLIPHRRDERVLREAAASAGWETPHPLAVWMEARQGLRGTGGSGAGSAHEEHGRARAGFRQTNRYIGQFKVWLRRFRGVADANLQRYLDWYLATQTPDPALRGGVSRAQALLILASRQLAWRCPGPPEGSGES
jgi:transposase-like protein